jgi:hypothetical protein
LIDDDMGVLSWVIQSHKLRATSERELWLWWVEFTQAAVWPDQHMLSWGSEVWGDWLGIYV